MSTIALKNVTKSFGRRKVVAVNDVTLEIPSSQFVVLLGPSGCGKSTTLRMIAGLEQPDDGEISINYKIVNDVPPQRRNLPFVFQNYALYPHMSVAKNIGFCVHVFAVSRRQRFWRCLFGFSAVVRPLAGWGRRVRRLDRRCLAQVTGVGARRCRPLGRRDSTGSGRPRGRCWCRSSLRGGPRRGDGGACGPFACP